MSFNTTHTVAPAIVMLIQHVKVTLEPLVAGLNSVMSSARVQQQGRLMPWTNLNEGRHAVQQKHKSRAILVK